MGDDGGQAGLVAAEGPAGAKLSEQARVAQVVPERLVGDGQKGGGGDEDAIGGDQLNRAAGGGGEGGEISLDEADVIDGGKNANGGAGFRVLSRAAG